MRRIPFHMMFVVAQGPCHQNVLPWLGKKLKWESWVKHIQHSWKHILCNIFRQFPQQLKINLSPENWWLELELEDVQFPFWNAPFKKGRQKCWNFRDNLDHLSTFLRWVDQKPTEQCWKCCLVVFLGGKMSPPYSQGLVFLPTKLIAPASPTLWGNACSKSNIPGHGITTPSTSQILRASRYHRLLAFGGGHGWRWFAPAGIPWKLTWRLLKNHHVW